VNFSEQVEMIHHLRTIERLCLDSIDDAGIDRLLRQSG
jgi:hypothetical protein